MSEIDKKWWIDIKWGSEHQTELFEKYGEKWIAIHNKKVIAFGANLGKVEEKAEQKTGKNNLAVLFLEDPMRFFHVAD